MANSEGKTIRQISELNRICHIGPIGRWGAVEFTFPFWFEEIVFNEDGTATWTTESGMFPRETVSLRWRMERWGRLIIEETDEEEGETLESAMEIGFKLQATEFGSRPGDGHIRLGRVLAMLHRPSTSRPTFAMPPRKRSAAGGGN